MMDGEKNLFVTPSTLEVDYDKNLTELYQAITDQNWERAIAVCRKDPVQAATWVVRHYHDDDDDATNEEAEIMWRFLPLHSACARQPPPDVVAALLEAYPDASKCIDDQGMYALHYACGNQAPREAVRKLLVSFPEAAKLTDPRGMLPIHYLACWGPSSLSVVDMLLVANSDIVSARDCDGNTPLDLALESDYADKEAVINILRKWLAHGGDAEEKSTTKEMSSSQKKTVGSSDFTSSPVPSTQRPMQRRTLARDPNETNTRGGATSRRESPDGNRSSLLDTASSSTVGSHAQSDAHRMDTRPHRFQYYQPRNKDLHYHTLRDTIDEAEEKKDEVSVDRSKGKITQPKEEIMESKRSWREEREPLRETKESEKSWIEELEQLRETKENESSWGDEGERQLRKLLDEANARVATLQTELKDTKSMLSATNIKVTNLQNEVEETEEKLATTTKELAETTEKLSSSKFECQGLRVTLGDMMEAHEKSTRTSSNMKDRLASLTISLESMMERQTELAKAVEKRDSKHKETFGKRQERLKELLEMDQQMEQEEQDFGMSLKKQTREMEAIAAVIAAARE
jgi:hypothetical protein